MQFKSITNNFEDDRGLIRDVLSHEPIDAVTVIVSKKGAVRGNHYHKDTYQWVYLLSGKLDYVSRAEGEKSKVTALVPGDLILSEPYEAHAIVALEDSEMVVLTRGPRGGKEYESDTFRLDSPLIP